MCYPKFPFLEEGPTYPMKTGCFNRRKAATEPRYPSTPISKEFNQEIAKSLSNSFSANRKHQLPGPHRIIPSYCNNPLASCLGFGGGRNPPRGKLKRLKHSYGGIIVRSLLMYDCVGVGSCACDISQMRIVMICQAAG